MTGIGHNNGPSMEPGAGFRRHAWGKARRELLPRMPLEVINMRMRRAQALGLDFRTYATVRAATGRDVIAFLFSSNALVMIRPGAPIPENRAAKVASIKNCARHLAVHGAAALAPAARTAAAAGVDFDGIRALPPFSTPWAGLRDDVKSWLAAEAIPGDAVLMIGETAFEREIATAGGLAGFVTGDRYFAAGDAAQ